MKLVISDSSHTVVEVPPDGAVLGREPPEVRGVKLESSGVSREHGAIFPINDHWFYRDLGSTNGSWVNAKRCEPHRPCLIRDGDILQLGDGGMRVECGRSALEPSLLVFLRTDFVAEYSLPEIGKVLTIGGSKSDLKLDVDVLELASLVVERRGVVLCAYQIAMEVPVFRNGSRMTQLTGLADRDELIVQPYQVIVNLPVSLDDASLRKQDPTFRGELNETFSGWDRREKSVEATQFGRVVEHDDPLGVEHTVGGTSNYETRAGSRSLQRGEVKPPSASTEEKIILGIGGLMVVAVLILLLWWLVF